MKTIGIIALSGDVEEESLNSAVLNLRNLGYNVKISNNIFNKNRYLAGYDKNKIQELTNFYNDSEIDIIMCARGGYGAIRLVNSIDYNVIKNNPKPIIGFSDVTALLLMIYKKTGVVTYHGPMACTDFADSNFDYSLSNMQRALNNEELDFCTNKIYKNGSANGIIWGGNLSTVVSLCGLDFIPDDDFIFFAEDLNEAVYKIDKMFTQLFNIDKFKEHCKGLVLGDFLDIDNQEWLDELFYELAKKHNLPVVGGFNITHNRKKITIPIGKKVLVENNILRICS